MLEILRHLIQPAHGDAVSLVYYILRWHNALLRRWDLEEKTLCRQTSLLKLSQKSMVTIILISLLDVGVQVITLCILITVISRLSVKEWITDCISCVGSLWQGLA